MSLKSVYSSLVPVAPPLFSIGFKPGDFAAQGIITSGWVSNRARFGNARCKVQLSWQYSYFWINHLNGWQHWILENFHIIQCSCSRWRTAQFPNCVISHPTIHVYGYMYHLCNVSHRDDKPINSRAGWISKYSRHIIQCYSCYTWNFYQKLVDNFLCWLYQSSTKYFCVVY